MITVPNVSVAAHFMPEDAAEAELAYLQLLHSPGATFQDLYGENWEEMSEEQIKADAAGVVLDINVDHVQSCGSSKAVLQKMADAFKASGTGSVITIVAAPSGNIWHYKSTVVLAVDGGEDWCVTGSTNATATAFLEGNSLIIFRSTDYANRMIKSHNTIKALCRQKHAAWQIMDLPTPKPTGCIV